MATWIDFKKLRQNLDFAAVLTHYGVELKLKAGGKQHQGFCPLPTHPKREGKRHSPSFSANLEKGIFQCFGCGAKGNAIDFACLMEGLDPTKGEEFRKAALNLQERFLPAATARKSDRKPEPQQAQPAPEAKAEAPQTAPMPATPPIINAPLDFELQGLDSGHPYLQSRGFTAETIAHFGLGYCARGLMQRRIAIPLHDGTGRLIGYAGRLVDDKLISEAEPKYKLPGRREHRGVVHEFQKSAFLYNAFRIPRPTDDVIVVEGFASVWWLWQAGYENAVALMGWSCSDAQAKLIVESVNADGRVWVMPDSDEAGARCAESVLARVAPHRFTRWVKLSGGTQPTDCTSAELEEMLYPSEGGQHA